MRLFPLALLAALPVSLVGAPVNVVLNRPVEADSIYSPEYVAANAVDGDSTSGLSRWLSNSDPMPHWLEVELDQSYQLSQMKFWTGHSAGPYPLYDFALQFWNGDGWVDLYSETGSTNDGAVDVSFGPVVSGNRIRLLATDGEDSQVRLYELEVYGEPHALTYNTFSPAHGGTLFDPAADLVVTFDAPIAAGSLAGIRIEDLDTGTDVGGISASVSGNDLAISHDLLATRGSYAVHIPEGVVVLGSDGTTPNGALYWEFEVAPLKPQVKSHTEEIPNLTDPVTVVFDRQIALVDGSGITLENFNTGDNVGGLSLSLSGDTLTVGHDPLVNRELYVLTIPAGSVEGTINGDVNDALRLRVYGGSSVLFATDFDTGLEGFNTWSTLNNQTPGDINWQWFDSSTPGPDYDGQYLRSKTNSSTDFAISPQVDLVAGRSYVLEFKALLNRTLYVGLTPSANLVDVQELDSIPSSLYPQSVRLEFTALSDGPQYLIFYNGETDPWQKQYIDAFLFTESILPAVRFTAPAAGSSHRERDAVPVQIEAFGIADELVSVELFDNDVSLGTLTESDGFYHYNWAYHAPGEHTLRVEATDLRGNVSTKEIPVTITFDDGTLPPFIGYNFDGGAEGWTTNGNGTPVGLRDDDTGRPGQSIYISGSATGGVDFSSPQIFLLAGETYTIEVGCKLGAGTGSLAFAFMATTEPGYPADTTGAQTFSVPAGPDWSVKEITFTVPENGAYYLTFFEPSLSGYIKVWFDDIRLIGNFNSVPSVTLTNPAGPVRTLAGADILLEAEASDVDGTIEEVSFRTVDGTLIAPDAVDTTEPYAYNWLDVAEGEYSIIARAIDDGSAVFASTARSVTVVPNNLSISTYLGDSATDDAVTAAAYLSDGTLVLGGILDPALFSGVTPLYLNGASAGDRGVVARLSEDGTSVLSVSVVGTAVHDLDIGANDRIHVAAADTGAVVLNSAADTVLWSNTYSPRYAHRIDAADDGTFAVMASEVHDYLATKQTGTLTYVYDSLFNELGQLAGAAAFTTDIAVDAASQTVILIGWKNVSAMEDDSDMGANPVDVPSMIGRAYDGTLKWRGYDWEKEASGDRWLNLYTNNMADTRGARVIVRNGKAYAAFEFDGGNTPLRFSPFDLAEEVPIVGGDKYHQMWGTSTVPKTFLGIYEPATGIYENGQWITNRELDDSDNMIRMRNGGLDVDPDGRVHLVGSAAYGLPITHDPFPGIYTGGAFHLVYSPDLSSREFVTRLSYRGEASAVAASPNGKIATGGVITDADSNALFVHNAVQTTASEGEDAWYAVGDYSAYYKFQPSNHPRLYFDGAGLQELRGKLDREPFSSIYAKFVEQIDTQDFFRPYDPTNANSVLSRARGLAIHYALSGDEALATQTRQQIEAALALIDADEAWADPAVKGLDSYHYARDLAVSYDLCVDAESWDPPFDYAISARLLSIATMIVEDGGTEQPNDPGSNWRGIRGASAGLALLGTDHQVDPELLQRAHGMVLQYLDNNQAGTNGHGWNPEGFNYTAYAIGNHVGHYALALEQTIPEWSLRDDPRLKWMAWTGFAGATTAYDIFGFGGVKTDWSDENPHIGGEGIYGLAFFFADEALLPGLRHAYDRLMGEQSPYGPTWDCVRQGGLFSLMFYPEDVMPVDPTEIWEWHRASDDSNGLGVFTFRNAYQDSNDSLVQFKTRQYALPQAHDGPDGLGFRVISHGDSFVVGGGRDSDYKERNQATVYPENPDSVTTWNRNTGSVMGTPLIKPDGGGHVIAFMTESNLGTTNHKRWLITDFESAATGADTTLIVADSSDNGLYWQLPTFLKNSISTSGNTFTITGTNGATLRGTILHPGGTPQITVGTKQRGSHYGLENGGTLVTEDPVTNPRIQENRYLYIEGSGDGDFLVVMTLVDAGQSHPAVSHLSGTVADATVQVGSRTYALQSDDVLYDGAAYSHPDAVVTFDADDRGTLGGAPVQTVPYGGSAVAPVVSPDSGYTFLGWNKAFDRVVKSMTVTALYDAIASGFGAWIADSLYGLSGADLDPGADPDRDGMVNLLEYALVLNPSLPDGAAVISIREENGELILSYRVRDGATDVTVAPMWSATMGTGSWNAVPAGNVSVTGSGPGYTEFEAAMPVGTGRIFMRLEVSQK